MEKANRVLDMDNTPNNVIPFKIKDKQLEEAIDALDVFQDRLADAVIEAYASPLLFEAMVVTMVRFIAVNYFENSNHEDPYGFIRKVSEDLVDEYEATINSIYGDGDDT